MNILVGPNNSGKSTIIGAFRALEAGLRKARARNPERVLSRGGAIGYRIPSDSIPISSNNTQTDYQDVESSVTFQLSNRNRLVLSFIRGDEDCFMYAESNDRLVNSTRAFKEAFPISVSTVPVLGPLEDEEAKIQEETVSRYLATHRASRHFRNYWWYNKEHFESFRQSIQQTWPGMEIAPPELLGDRTFLSMFCQENRITRELYWTGFGFQVWCQLLTHISRTTSDTLLVIDEPDIYLHPDLQRQLLAILRESGPDILIATHSTDIIAEAEPTDILVVEKAQRSAKRVKSPEGISNALKSLGSVQNFAMTQIERAGRVLFIEGNDFAILRRYARRVGLNELASGVGIVPFPLGGFPSAAHVRGVSQGVRGALEKAIVFGGVFDRDFRSNEEVLAIQDELKRVLSLVAILGRKEIENYLLVPAVLDRALSRAIQERARRTGHSVDELEPIADILDKISRPARDELRSQYIAKRIAHLSHSPKDGSTIALETTEMFEEKWGDSDHRMAIVAGKKTLGDLNSFLQKTYGINLSPAKIIEAFRIDEVPWDLMYLLRDLDSFRTTLP